MREQILCDPVAYKLKILDAMPSWHVGAYIYNQPSWYLAAIASHRMDNTDSA